jgi:endo-1,4-beta-D-glucanase Y
VGGKSKNDNVSPLSPTCRGTAEQLVVRDANKQQLAYVYYETEPGRRSAAKLLTKDEARRIAANIAKLLLGKIARGDPRIG